MHEADTGDGVAIACGSGLAIELAATRGAVCSGIDAAERLVTVARGRNPGREIVVGDMCDLPWPDESFDVITSFRGVWGTTPTAMTEACRVLRHGGRTALTIWGNVGRTPGAWMFEPFRWAPHDDVEHQADMVSRGRPGRGEAFLGAAGFEAIQAIGEIGFRRRATELAARHVRPGLPLRAELELFGYTFAGSAFAGLMWWTQPDRGGPHVTHAAAQAAAGVDDVIIYWRPG